MSESIQTEVSEAAPDWLTATTITWTGVAIPGMELVYGSNGHQKARFFATVGDDDPLAIHHYDRQEGKPLSMTNILDVSNAVNAVRYAAAGMDVNTGEVPPLSIAVKHLSPVGGSYHKDPNKAMEMTIDGDKQDVSGGIIAMNTPLTPDIARIITSHNTGGARRNIDVLAAPAASREAIDILKRSKTGMFRALINPALESLGANSMPKGLEFRSVPGGMIVEESYRYVPNPKDSEQQFQVYDEPIGDDFELDPRTIFAAAIGSTSLSNTVSLVQGGEGWGMLIGNGVGQPARHKVASLAVERARLNGHRLEGAHAYSDSFFPFEDGPQILIDAGISEIFTMRGADRDKHIMELFRNSGVRMITVPVLVGRGFKH